MLVLLPALASAGPIYSWGAPYPAPSKALYATHTSTSGCGSATITTSPFFDPRTGMTLESSVGKTVLTSTCNSGTGYVQLSSGIQNIKFVFSSTTGSYSVSMSWTVTADVQESTFCTAATFLRAYSQVSLNGSVTDDSTVPASNAGSGTAILYTAAVTTCNGYSSFTPSSKVYTVTFTAGLVSAHIYTVSSALWTTCEGQISGGGSGANSIASADVAKGFNQATLTSVQIV